MKMIKQLACFMLITLLFSCDSNTASNSQPVEHFKLSLDSWNNLKIPNQDSYTYTVSTNNNLGIESNTTIVVINGEITSRYFESYTQYDDDNEFLEYKDRIILKSFTENSETINTHECVEGDDAYDAPSLCFAAPALTIDDLYNTCLNKYLNVDPYSNEINFTVDNSNLIQNCYYTSEACEDGCFFGIKISHFEWLNKTAL